MRRLTLGDVKTACARVLKLKSSDARLADYVSRAQERLLYLGKWVGTYGKYRVCVNNSVLTWPREIETIEAWALDSRPGIVRNLWYEFLSSGPGIMSEDTVNGRQLHDLEDAASYDDPDGGLTKRFKIYVTKPETTTEPFIIQHYDGFGQWVRTKSTSGAYIDGEEITIPTNAAGLYQEGVSTVQKHGLIRIIKPVTNGDVLLYEEDTSTGSLKHLGTYQPRETRPVYRRSLVPGLTNLASNNDGTCEYISVSVMGKMRHIPVVDDNDFLIISHPEAIRLACQAIYKEENDNAKEAVNFMLLAEKQLQDQLDHHQGSGAVMPMRLEEPAVFGGAIQNIQ